LLCRYRMLATLGCDQAAPLGIQRRETEKRASESERERERHDTPTWELRSNLRLLVVNLLSPEPANEKSR
jgi:hypothetical protein